MTEAIHNDRNSGSPNGAHGETECLAAIGATTGMLIISAIFLSGGAPGVPARPPRCRTGETPVVPRTANDERPATRPQPPPPAAATTAHNKQQCRLSVSPPHTESPVKSPGDKS